MAMIKPELGVTASVAKSSTKVSIFHKECFGLTPPLPESEGAKFKCIIIVLGYIIITIIHYITQIISYIYHILIKYIKQPITTLKHKL